MVITVDDVFQRWVNAAKKAKSPRRAYDTFTPYKADRNQPEIVKAFRALGLQVKSLHAAGDGVYDVLCAYQWLVASVEIKDGQKVPSARKFTPAQVKWGESWQGLRYVATCTEDCVSIAAEMKRLVSLIGNIRPLPAGCQEEQYRGGVTR